MKILNDWSLDPSQHTVLSARLAAASEDVGFSARGAHLEAICDTVVTALKLHAGGKS